MSVKKEFDRLKNSAWREFAGDVKTTSRRIKRAGTAYIKAHPLVVLGGGAVLGALTMAVFKKRPAAAAYDGPKQGVARLFQTARFWLGRAITLAADCAELARMQDEAACRKA
jgi:hypothetical protein